MPIPISPGARDAFPASAGNDIRIDRAWKPYDGKDRPDPAGPEGWTPVPGAPPATVLAAQKLRADGYTYALLHAPRVAKKDSFRTVAISKLT